MLRVGLIGEVGLRGVSVRVAVAMRRHQYHGNTYKEGKHLIEAVAYSVRGSVHHHPGRGMVVCRQTSCWLHLNQKAAGS